MGVSFTDWTPPFLSMEGHDARMGPSHWTMFLSVEGVVDTSEKKQMLKEGFLGGTYVNCNGVIFAIHTIASSLYS